MKTIEQYCKESYQNACEKGFHDNPEYESLPVILVLIISELCEAIEAHRKNKFADKKKCEIFINVSIASLETKNIRVPYNQIKNDAYYLFVKDTFEDEIADIFIRLFDYCGKEKINVEKELHINKEILSNLEEMRNIPAQIFFLIKELCYIYDYKCKEKIVEFFETISFFCKLNHIDIWYFIDLKMEYNKSRKYKHEKEY